MGPLDPVAPVGPVGPVVPEKIMVSYYDVINEYAVVSNCVAIVDS
jgi:hypothetical protein